MQSTVCYNNEAVECHFPHSWDSVLSMALFSPRTPRAALPFLQKKGNSALNPTQSWSDGNTMEISDVVPLFP
jgi:hypothetical protein